MLFRQLGTSSWSPRSGISLGPLRSAARVATCAVFGNRQAPNEGSNVTDQSPGPGQFRRALLARVSGWWYGKRILAEHAAFKAEVDAVRVGITGTLRLGLQFPTASATASWCCRRFARRTRWRRVQVCSRPSCDRAVPTTCANSSSMPSSLPETQDSDDVDEFAALWQYVLLS